jgi:hypothetical protein
VTKTYDLLQAVKACLAEITTANGYGTNAGVTVTLEPGQVRDDWPEFLSVVLESMERPADPAWRAIGLRGCVIAIIAKVPADLEDAELALHKVVEDIENAMADQQRRFPAGTDFPRYVGMTRIPPADGLKWVGAVVRYTANVRR